MIIKLFALTSNKATISPADISHIMSNIGRVYQFLQENFNSSHWAVVIFNGPHTSGNLAVHSTIFGFNYVSPYEIGQSWGAHVFQNGNTDVFFEARRNLTYDEITPILCK
ncbi:hypothetical protein M413DRAFT_75654 [Hebeloma cylindrosporum]|uniref:Uncharacterized protein n=1 Tax=Hebeloma cylindrosporum TaxID=76867 RepID=A0A0C2XLZ9_HEBCY|nr:hypothetical protein M413DRAFT_75654 [Hebeloma cylindrosporum h7]